MLPFWMNSTGKRAGWQHGWHGYDNELMDMRGIFLAFGPGRRGNDRVLSVIRSQGRVPRGSWRREGWRDCFMSNAEQTQPVSVKHRSLAGVQMLLGFGKCG